MRTLVGTLLLVSACTGPDDTADDAFWDASTLVIASPSSGAFLPLGEPATFEAHVLDAEGVASGFQAIEWASSIDPGWTPIGTAFEDASLPAGVHDLTATARLPNGDRLATTVGGIRVQSPYAGTYAGTLALEADITWKGTPYAASCAGGALLTVSPEGDVLTGQAPCFLSLMGYELEAMLVVDASCDQGAIEGTVSADLSFYTLDLPTSGTVTEEGDLFLDFAGGVPGFATFEGSIEAVRVTREVEAT
ncbi:MAG: hypothetical protein JXB39_08350 [Deltaproteobacteria bacterium]|nr:hypothetical protein [Deltaproteobacteria bacterium]